MVRPFARLALPAGLFLLLLAAGTLPSAQAEQYEGPGHSGMVPLGDGGLVASNVPEVGLGFTQIPLEGLPEKTCRIVLDSNETYARTLLVWSVGNETAYVAAKEGARDAPFRVVSHWERDMNGGCTVEVTPDGKVWHDPRGRPFIDMVWQQRFVHYDVEPGEWFTVGSVLENNGTLEETVNVTVTHLQEEWEVRNSTGIVDRSVAPEGSLRFAFDILLPDRERTGTKLIVFEATGGRSGWTGKTTIVLHVQGTEKALNTIPEEEDDGVDTRNHQKLPDQKVARTGQIPTIPVLPVALIVLGVLEIVRSRR